MTLFFYCILSIFKTVRVVVSLQPQPYNNKNNLFWAVPNAQELPEGSTESMHAPTWQRHLSFNAGFDAGFSIYMQVSLRYTFRRLGAKWSYLPLWRVSDRII